MPNDHASNLLLFVGQGRELDYGFMRRLVEQTSGAGGLSRRVPGLTDVDGININLRIQLRATR